MGDSERLSDEMRGVRVKCQVWKGCGWLSRSHTHRRRHGEVERWSSTNCTIPYYPLNFSSAPHFLVPSSLHSPSCALSIFHPLHLNYWCHCKLNCGSRLEAFTPNSSNHHLLQWKWRIFSSANLQVCVIGGREENAGWLPSLLWNVFIKGSMRLWSLDSRPCISNSLLICLSLCVLCKHFSPHVLFIHLSCCCSNWKYSPNFYSYSQLLHVLILCYLLPFSTQQSWMILKKSIRHAQLITDLQI